MKKNNDIKKLEKNISFYKSQVINLKNDILKLRRIASIGKNLLSNWRPQVYYFQWSESKHETWKSCLSARDMAKYHAHKRVIAKLHKRIKDLLRRIHKYNRYIEIAEQKITIFKSLEEGRKTAWHMASNNSPMPEVDLSGVFECPDNEYYCPKCKTEPPMGEAYYGKDGEKYPQCYNEYKASNPDGNIWDWAELHYCNNCNFLYHFQTGAY